MDPQRETPKNADAGRPVQRRGFISSTAMTGGLVAAYGGLGAVAARFLFPGGDDAMGWQFVAVAENLRSGDSLDYTSPSGLSVVVARQSEGAEASNFVALSSICPHLGCQVHWESHNDRFFCPCHNGAFDRDGQPTEGPPKAANQPLIRFELKVEEGLLYIKAPLHALNAPTQTASAPGQARGAAKPSTAAEA